ncbi:MAG: hypothetical protein ACFFDP_03245 [Promethearchaeota archaeon]
MIERSKIVQPKTHMIDTLKNLEAKSVLDYITPTARTFMCRRTGQLVDGGYCAFFCDIGKQQEIHFDPDNGIDVFCLFAYNELLGQMGDGAHSDS